MIKCRDITLGSTVKEVMDNFLNHPGEMDKMPFGFNICQGFEFFYDVNGKLNKKFPGCFIPLTEAEEQELMEDISDGHVELYLTRPTSGLPPYGRGDVIIIHASTGVKIPFS